MWQTYDFIGDVKDETTLRVELLGNGIENTFYLYSM